MSGYYNFAGCRKQCLIYAEEHGPGCCRAANNGECIFVIKGKLIDHPDKANTKAVYCTNSYHAGSNDLNSTIKGSKKMGITEKILQTLNS